MYCKKCGSEIGKDDKFCASCGNLVENSHDLDGVTKISTPLFLLFAYLSLSIYTLVKIYRMTGDIRKIVPKKETVSPLVITSFLFMSFISNLSSILSSLASEEVAGFAVWIVMCSFIVHILLYIHIVYHTLNNIREIAHIKQNKDLKYNKFWAYICGFVYINFVFNTYDQRLIERKD